LKYEATCFSIRNAIGFEKPVAFYFFTVVGVLPPKLPEAFEDFIGQVVIRSPQYIIIC
jgi:hypothetical protein